MYGEFLITSKNNQETTFFTDDIEITLDVLRKKYPNSKIEIIRSGGKRMSAPIKKSSVKKSVPKKDKIGTGATTKPEATVKKEAVNQKSTLKVEKRNSVALVKKAPIKRIRSRFSEADEKDIVKMYQNDSKYSEIAAKYNSPKSSIYMVLVRQKAIIPQSRKKK